jgi:hypothetical protein
MSRVVKIEYEALSTMLVIFYLTKQLGTVINPLIFYWRNLSIEICGSQLLQDGR